MIRRARVETRKPANNAQGKRWWQPGPELCWIQKADEWEVCFGDRLNWIRQQGADGKRGVSHESHVFQMSNWIDGDAISEMRKTEDGRSLKGKSSILNRVSLRLLLDRGGGMKKAFGGGLRSTRLPPSHSFTLCCDVPWFRSCSLIAYGTVSPPRLSVIPLTLLYFLHIPRDDLPHCFHFCLLLISPATRISPAVGRNVVRCAHCCIPR